MNRGPPVTLAWVLVVKADGNRQRDRCYRTYLGRREDAGWVVHVREVKNGVASRQMIGSDNGLAAAA